MHGIGRDLGSQDLALIPSVAPPTLRPGVLAFFFKSWDETDRVSPENWPFPRLKALHWIPCN